jgi:glutamyl-Q tRNA(Asp) synthetase
MIPVTDYVGRFAPSPSGPLHAGSLVAAMASYLDARAHYGRWLVRIEDVDAARSQPAAATQILHTLDTFGMRSDGEVWVQSTRSAAYQQAFEQLRHAIYACACSRKELADSNAGARADGGLIYPGTCRAGMSAQRSVRAWRLRVPNAGTDNGIITFDDRRLGKFCEELALTVGDFVLKRADGCWAYQLAVVVDDAAQSVTHVVRGVDLLESTGRQIYLQRLLGVTTPAYLHVPLVTNALGEKLSKQTGAAPLDETNVLTTLSAAARCLDLLLPAPDTVDGFWCAAVAAWRDRYIDLAPR